MCSALKILVAIVATSAVASEERTKRADYGTVSTNPWQSPTGWGYRPSGNYNTIQSTRITRVNNYNPYIQRNQLRNLEQSSDVYNNRDQSSGWVPIIPNRQNSGGRYGQNGLQQQREYSRLNSYNTINAEEQLLNERARQRQPNYSVQRNRGNELNQQAPRSVNGKLIIQSNQNPTQSQSYRNLNQEPRYYVSQQVNYLNNGGRLVRPTYNTRVIPQQNLRQEFGQSIESNELPIVEGRFLGVKVQDATPVVETEQINVGPNQQKQVLRAIDSEGSIRTYRLPVQEQTLGGNLQQASSGYAVNEPQTELSQDALRRINSQHLIDSNQLAGLQGENLAARYQQETLSPLLVQSTNQPNVGLKQSLELLASENLRSRQLEALRGINTQHPNQPAGVQGGNLAGRFQQEISSPLLVQGTNQPNVALEQSLGILASENLRSRQLEALKGTQNQIGSNQLAAVRERNLAERFQQEISSPSLVQSTNQPNVGLKQSLGLFDSENLRSRQLEALRESYLSKNVQQNGQQLQQGLDNSANNGRYTQTLALVNSKPIFSSNQPQAVQGRLLGNIVDQQYGSSLDQPRPQLLKLIPQNQALNINNARFLPQSSASFNSGSSLLSSQSPNQEWRQGRLSALGELRNNVESSGELLAARNPNYRPENPQELQGQNQNEANQQPDVYTYAELTAKIWKLIKSNPTMMSNIQDLREQLLNRNSRNEQIRQLEGLLREARKYNRNIAKSAANQPRESLDEQNRDAIISELINTMNRNDIDSNSANPCGQVPCNSNGRSDQARYIVRPTNVNPLIKNILFSTARRNETQAQNTLSGGSIPLVYRPSTSIPLPQLEVAEPFGLDQLDHHYDLTQWKQVTEALKGNPFLQQYNVLEHLV